MIKSMSNMIPDLRYTSSESLSSLNPTRSEAPNNFRKILDETPREKPKKKKENSPWEPVANPPPPTPLQPPASSEAFSACPPPVQALFEEAIETFKVIHHEGDTLVTFSFAASSPKHALLAGTRITLREFSTAPKVFNIEIAAPSTMAHELMKSHGAALLQAFHQGDFSFSVERLDVEFDTEPHFREDPSTSDEEESTP